MPARIIYNLTRAEAYAKAEKINANGGIAYAVYVGSFAHGVNRTEGRVWACRIEREK